MEIPHFRNVVSAQVRKHRSRQNLTQQDLASRYNLSGLDIGRETVSQIERGVRGVSDLEMILLSKALQIDLADLVPKKLPKWKKDLRRPNAFE